MQYFGMKLVQCNEYLIITLVTDGLVIQHQGASSNSAEYAFIRFQFFMG